MQNEEKSFLDTKTIIAIVAVGVLFFGWQKYLESKYPDFYKRTPKAEQSTVPPSQEGTIAAEMVTPTEGVTKVAGAVALTDVQETSDVVDIDQKKFALSSMGMGIKSVELKDYTDRKGIGINLGVTKEKALFQWIDLSSNKPIPFSVQKVNEFEWLGTAQLAGTQIVQKIVYQQKSHSWHGELKVTIPEGVSAPRLGVVIPEEKHPPASSSFFLPSFEHQEFVVNHENTTDRINASSASEVVEKEFKSAKLVAIGSQYFATGFLDKSEVFPQVELKSPLTGELLALVKYELPPQAREVNLSWIGYAGPKSFEVLKGIDPLFENVIHFGFFATIGKFLLKVLHFSHDLVGNWGFAIICLTLLVRLIVLPFALMSYKSMKRMAAIQPQLQSLRERYKDDPTALNRETMNLMRSEKVNPLGGCLPMLLQMPVFFALYQMIGQSIELYQAPFIWWIQDLSLKDPFYVLPVLMGVTLFIQQKITPTTMDPLQAKILLWMPVVFSVFTLSLPAGLTLYIFVSTLFGVIQQKLFMIEKKPDTGSLNQATLKSSR